MNSDIRVSTGFYNHIKRRRLQQKLGADGVLAIIDLWLFMATHQPDGDLSNFSPEEIALAANYQHSPENLLAALENIGFIDAKLNKDGSESRKLHDWEIHNAWAANAKQRSESARKLARKRWDKKYANKDFNAVSNATRMHDTCETQCDAHTVGNAPSPSPKPSQKKEQNSVWDSPLTETDVADLNSEITKEEWINAKKKIFE
jgi:hypothetical protein